jgi:hypothetical protein
LLAEFFYFVYMSFWKRMVLVLMCVAGVAQAQDKPVETPDVASPVAFDSIAYYEEQADYNYKKFRTDETLSEVFFWTSVGLTVASPILVFASAGVADCYGFEGCQDGSLALNIAAISTTLLVLPSWITYGAFRTAKFIRQKKYNEYYGRKEELKRQRVQAVPLLNPVDGRYGVALAFSI